MIEFAMAEKGPIININNLESKFVVGKVEKSVERKIEETAKKILDSKLLDKDNSSRNSRADEVVDSLGFGFSTYKDMVDATFDDSRPSAQKNAKESFDLLKKSMSIAMNSGIDQKAQTALNLGVERTRSVLPEVFNYTNNGVLGSDLAESVVDITITEPTIREGLRKLDKIRSRVDITSKVEANSLADKMENEVVKLLELEIDDDKEHELMGVKSYLNTEIAILRGEDKTVDASDISAILGIKLDNMVEKMGEVIDTLDSKFKERGVTQEAYEKAKNGDYSGFKPRVNADGEYEGREMAWVVTEDAAADAFKFMADDLRWSTWTPPEWFKKKSHEEQTKIEYMVMINDGASFLSKFQNSDVDKCRTNPLYGGFDNEKLTKIFTGDFKLVMSKMLNDLCEQYVNDDGVKSLRYKEGYDTNYYKPASGDKSEFKPWFVIKSVEDKLKNINRYKDELALFIAQSNGRETANPMDKMNAYTAWNLWFMMGDSSFADRLRCIPPKKGLISDKLRTLNPESKALKKWKILHRFNGPAGGEMLRQAEWFGGPMASYIESVMRLERDIGRPLDGKKTLQSKIIDGDRKFLPNQTCYGWFDICDNRNIYKNGERCLQSGEKVILSDLLFNYGKYSGSDFIKNGDDFDFGTDQMDCWADFRDMQEASVDALSLMTGKITAGKDMDAWVNKMKSTMGLANGILMNGDPLLTYVSRPEFLGNCLIGSFGVDMTRLSSDCIYMRVPKELGNDSSGYNLLLNRLITRDLTISNSDVNVNSVLRFLGVDVKDGENPSSFSMTVKTDKKMFTERGVTARYYKELSKKTNGDSKVKVLEEKRYDINSLSFDKNNKDVVRLLNAFNNAVNSGDEISANRLYDELVKLKGV